MQNLFKFALLLLFLNTSVFADRYVYYFITETNQPKKYSYTGDINSYIRVGNDIFKSEVIDNIEYLNSQDNYDKSSVFYRFGNDNAKAFIFLNQEPKKVGCWTHYGHDTFQNKADCDEPWYQSSDATKLNLHAFKFLNLEKVATCQPDEHFNTETKQCQKCPEGQSWDSENNRCYDDCSDVNKNKWSWTDGACTDCSKETTDDGVAQCYCKSIGSSYKTSHVTVCPDGGSICITSCDDGSQFNFKKPNTPDIPKPDNNNTTPSNPGGSGNQNPGGSGGDNGGGSGGNQGGGSGGNGGNSGGGSGGNQGGDNSGGSSGNNNGNNQGNGNSGGGSGGSGSGNGNGKDPKFNPGDFDFKDLEKDVNDFKSKYSDALDTVYNSFTNTKQGIEQFIANVQGKGMNGITKKNVPTTCPRIYTINFNGYPSELNFDFCKVVSPASGAFYHLFYVIFFLGFLMLIVKLLILSF
ncbi:hypothetical protein [Campylobacter sp. RM15925]|uniref:hypothetical protein n=1 Tax=Campylobacter sp. RM15925 TaxID=1705724 RepID=UPI001475666D|nr:hypothetical protein [Campylobacter sp. RM15925]